MANVRNGNTFFIDTQYSVSTDELAKKGIRLVYLFVSSSSATNQLTLADSLSAATKINVQNINNQGNAGNSVLYDFNNNPMLFPNGIRPTKLQNCNATCVVIDPTG